MFCKFRLILLPWASGDFYEGVHTSSSGKQVEEVLIYGRKKYFYNFCIKLDFWCFWAFYQSFTKKGFQVPDLTFADFSKVNNLGSCQLPLQKIKSASSEVAADHTCAWGGSGWGGLEPQNAEKHRQTLARYFLDLPNAFLTFWTPWTFGPPEFLYMYRKW